MRIVLILVLLAGGLRGLADEKRQENRSPDGRRKAEEEVRKRIDEAVAKAVKWLLKNQKKDGSFEGTYNGSYPQGYTALGLLALAKAGLGAEHKAVKAAYSYMIKQPLNRVYSVALALMAVEALYAPDEKEALRRCKPYRTVVRGLVRRNMPATLNRWVRDAVAFLVKAQGVRGIWSYSAATSGSGDLSNSQYALLGLYAARNMGFKVPTEPFKRAADFLVKAQDEKGPEVKWFPVPAADFSMSQLKRLEQEFYRRLRGTPEAERAKMRTTVIEDPYSRFGPEHHKMSARGWTYRWTADTDPKRKTSRYNTGSMTSAGIGCLVICKAAMEGGADWRRRRAAVNKAIRDGCAWLAKHFSVTGNPSDRGGTSSGHHFYYLYGLERAGVLALVQSFGKHAWYAKGVQYLLAHQDAKGYWGRGEYTTTVNKKRTVRTNICDTCFAILFLKRGTVPVAGGLQKEVVTTGSGIFGEEKPTGGLGLVVEKTDSGVAVKEVKSGSPAAGANLRPGDIIRGFSGRVVHSVQQFHDLEKIYVEDADTTYVVLIVERGDLIFQTVIRLRKKEASAAPQRKPADKAKDDGGGGEKEKEKEKPKK